MTLSTVIFWAIFYLKTAKIIDESLILAIVSRNYSTKPSYKYLSTQTSAKSLEIHI
jgi:hypothetical protein